MPDPQKSKDQIFQEALHLTPQEQTHYLTRACQGDQELRVRIEEMLRAAATRAVGQLSEEVTLQDPEPLTEGAGSVIGHYKLLQPIGEGGFGVVYMAEQTVSPVASKGTTQGRNRSLLEISKSPTWGFRLHVPT